MSSHSGHHHHHHRQETTSTTEAVTEAVLDNLKQVVTEGINALSANVTNSSLSMSVDHSSHHEMDHSDHNAMNDMMSHGVTSGHGDHTTSTHGVHMGMSMTFHGGFEEVILFDGWKTETIGAFVASCFGIFLFALIYEGLKYFREFLFKRSLAGSYTSACSKGPQPEETRPVQYMDQVLLPAPTTIWSSQHLLQTGLHMVQFIVSYLLMLIFMTYNVWLCLACVLGSGLGYLMFGWRKSVVVDVTEHCH